MWGIVKKLQLSLKSNIVRSLQNCLLWHRNYWTSGPLNSLLVVVICHCFGAYVPLRCEFGIIWFCFHPILWNILTNTLIKLYVIFPSMPYKASYGLLVSAVPSSDFFCFSSCKNSCYEDLNSISFFSRSVGALFLLFFSCPASLETSVLIALIAFAYSDASPKLVPLKYVVIAV